MIGEWDGVRSSLRQEPPGPGTRIEGSPHWGNFWLILEMQSPVPETLCSCAGYSRWRIDALKAELLAESKIKELTPVVGAGAGLKGLPLPACGVSSQGARISVCNESNVSRVSVQSLAGVNLWRLGDWGGGGTLWEVDKFEELWVDTFPSAVAAAQEIRHMLSEAGIDLMPAQGIGSGPICAWSVLGVQNEVPGGFLVPVWRAHIRRKGSRPQPDCSTATAPALSQYSSTRCSDHMAAHNLTAAAMFSVSRL